MKHHTIGLLLACAAALPACASSQPTAQLEKARDQYRAAAHHDASQLSLDALHDAKEALEEAEKAHAESPGSAKEADLAYIAERKAHLAMIRGNIAAAQRTERNAEQTYARKQAALLDQTKTQYDQTQRELEERSEDLEERAEDLQEERAARAAAETRAQKAMRSLQDLAQVKEESRGMVITLDGAVLFLVGKANLLPIAQEGLDRVAETIKDVGGVQKVTIEGHTDSQGAAEDNRVLSQHRAQSVADYLTSKGIDERRINVVGKGETEPIASNDSSEGRANNRRVEIIIGNAGDDAAE